MQNSAILLLGIYIARMYSYVNSETCARIFIAALIIKALNWKLPKCPLEGKLVYKLQYIHILKILYNNQKKVELQIYTVIWINLLSIILSKGSQT